MQKTDFMNAVNRFEYTINMTGRVQISLLWKQILLMQKNRFEYCEIQTRKSIQVWRLDLNMTGRLQISLMWKQILLMQKNRFEYCEIQTRKSIQIWRLDLKKIISLGVLWGNSEQFFK